MLYRLENVKQVYGGRMVLDIPRLSIRDSTIYTLLGPNGAGKTTLLKILALLERPTSGSIEFSGSRISWDKTLFRFRRDVVLLDQSPILFSGSVLENVGYGLAIRKVPRREREERSREALRQVGMEHFAAYNAKGLSGGETKRVALARALVLRPRVLICDEPTANVDNENQVIILNMLRLLKETLQTSVIFSTHYLAQSSGLAEEKLVLQNGRLAGGLTQNIYYGSRVDADERSVTIRMNGGDGSGKDLRLPLTLCPFSERNLRLEMDGDKMRIRSEGGAGEGICLDGKVTLLEAAGDTVRVVIGAAFPVSLSLSMAQYAAENLVLGQKITLFIPYSAITLSPCTLS